MIDLTDTGTWVRGVLASFVAVGALLPVACNSDPDAESSRQPVAAGQSVENLPAHGGEATQQHAVLAGTHWRLLRFQSMDDTIGEITPGNLSVYTMTLGEDGSVQMRLNCNRAAGTWSHQPAGDGISGTFQFGPLATTRALCPPPSMDEQIARDAEWIRGYLLRDGQLHLSLAADGGIYSWERAPNASSPQPTRD